MPVSHTLAPGALPFLFVFADLIAAKSTLFSFPCLRAKLISFHISVGFLSLVFICLIVHPLSLHISFDLLICSHCFLGTLYILDWVTICVTSISS